MFGPGIDKKLRGSAFFGDVYVCIVMICSRYVCILMFLFEKNSLVKHGSLCGIIKQTCSKM